MIQWFAEFFEVVGRSDKKTFKENLTPFFATADQCADYVGEPYAKFEERTPDKWNELLKNVFDEGQVQLNVLSSKEESCVVKPDGILVEQMREKNGGQVVEIVCKSGEKDVQMALCELASGNWVIAICKET